MTGPVGGGPSARGLRDDDHAAWHGHGPGGGPTPSRTPRCARMRRTSTAKTRWSSSAQLQCRDTGAPAGGFAGARLIRPRPGIAAAGTPVAVVTGARDSPAWCCQWWARTAWARRPVDWSAPRRPPGLPLLRSHGRRGRRAQEEIGPHTPFVVLLPREAVQRLDDCQRDRRSHARHRGPPHEACQCGQAT